MIDLLIIGASCCCVVVNMLKLNNWNCLIVDKRNHIAGNCFDTKNLHGQLIHKYGPHYFRTNNVNILNYLSKFTEWISGNYVVKSNYKNELYPFPINLETLEKFFNEKLTKNKAIELLNNKCKKIQNPKNSEEFVLSRVGEELYKAFYYGYTLKQWNQKPADLAPSVCGRIPIRFNRQNDYVNHKYKVMPKLGFSEMFKAMTSNPLIKFSYNTDYEKIRSKFKPKIATLYTGPIDAYFDFSMGKLPWRSLEFRWKTFSEEFRQPCVQINYPNKNKYTRTVEIKHVTKQKCPTTSISYEYPKENGPPYYPIPTKFSSNMYEKYKKLAFKETAKNNVFFAGRLAEYTILTLTKQSKEACLSTLKL